MSEEVSPTVIKATQSSLGKYVKRPPLTEKLLGRPPFKYLHDIFTSVIKITGFMEGLFTAAEMNPDSFKDRDSKIAYLDKVIRLVGLVNGKEVAVKPSAIVAGKEADKTNLFLQDLAAALGKKVNNAEFVKRVLNGESPAAASAGGSKKQPREDSKERRKDEREHSSKERRREDEGSRDKKRDRDEGGKEKSRDREKERDKDREIEKDKDREREKEKEREGEKERGKDREKDRDKDREREKEKDKDRESRGKEKDRGRSDKDGDKERTRVRGDDKKSRTSDAQGSSNEATDSGQRASKEDEGSPNRIPRPSSAKGNRRLRDGRRAPSNAEAEEELQRKQRGDTDESGGGGRTYSAKPAPLLKSKAGTSVVDDGSGKRVSGVIIERDQDSDDDQFVVEEAPSTLLAGGFGDGGGGGGLGDDDDEEGRDEQHGGLVKEMLKSKQEFKEAGGAKEAGRTVVTTTDANRKREKAATAREIDRLKQQLQALTREANPLGKIIDYVQEDLESMSKELERWRAETKEVMARLKQEQSTADASLNGLRHQLSELEQAERDKLDLIATVKANIVRNDERISKMIEAMSRS